MKKYILIIALLILFVPIIPYEKKIDVGVVSIENRSIAEWVWDRYQTVQARSVELEKEKPSNEETM